MSRYNFGWRSWLRLTWRNVRLPLAASVAAGALIALVERNVVLGAGFAGLFVCLILFLELLKFALLLIASVVALPIAKLAAPYIKARQAEEDAEHIARMMRKPPYEQH